VIATVEDWQKQLTDCLSLCFRAALEWNEMERVNIPQLTAKPGSPCFNFRGFCDVFHKCREVTIYNNYSSHCCTNFEVVPSKRCYLVKLNANMSIVSKQ